MVLDDHHKLKSKFFTEVLKVGNPVDHIIPFILVVVEAGQMLGVDEDVFAVDVAFAQPVDKLIEEVLG
jgi:hypothetical protein